MKKLDFENFVKVLGTEQNWKENVFIFLNYLKQTNSINDYDECELISNEKFKSDADELELYLSQNGIKLNKIFAEEEFIAISVKSYKLIAWCAKLPEEETLKGYHSWSALFLDGKIRINKYDN